MSDGIHELIRAEHLLQRRAKTSLDKTLGFIRSPNKLLHIQELNEEEWDQIDFQGAYDLMKRAEDDSRAQEGVMQMTQAWADGVFTKDYLRYFSKRDRTYVRPDDDSISELVKDTIINASYPCPVEIFEPGFYRPREETLSIEIKSNDGYISFTQFKVKSSENKRGRQISFILRTEWEGSDEPEEFQMGADLDNRGCECILYMPQNTLGLFDSDYPTKLRLGRFLKDVKSTIDTYIAEHVRGEE